MTVRKHADDIPYAQVVETRTSRDCAFCGYFNTPYNIVVAGKLIRICGRCAESLIPSLRIVAKADKRRMP